MMLIWLLVCMTGWLGPVANAAHVTGLLSGLVFAAQSASRRR
jgi:membrane associated rhomboid family serine protease